MSQRPKSHIIADHAVDIFKSKMPRHWIFREQTRQDYGVDVEIELVNRAGFLSGEVIKAQVKGHERMRFSRHGVYQERVKGSTAEYWLRLRMPIILASVDITHGVVYWTDAAKVLREAPYDELLKPRLTLPILQNSIFGGSASLHRLVAKALHDYDWRTTAERFEAALDRMPELLRFAAWLDRCDTWMPLEQEDARRLTAYHDTIRTLAAAAGVDSASIHPLAHWKNLATRRGFDEREELPHEFAAAACWELLPRYFEALRAHQKALVESEISFWWRADEQRVYRWLNENFPDPGAMQQIQQLAFEYEARGW